MISYRPGTWFGIVGEHATVLLPPSEKARAGALWPLVDDGAGFDEVLDALLADGLRALPGFVLLTQDGTTTRIVVRGPSRATFDTLGGQAVVEGSASATWVEQTLRDVTGLSIVLEESHEHLLTLHSGLVRLAALASPAAAAAAPAAPAAPAPVVERVEDASGPYAAVLPFPAGTPVAGSPGPAAELPVELPPAPSAELEPESSSDVDELDVPAWASASADPLTDRAEDLTDADVADAESGVEDDDLSWADEPTGVIPIVPADEDADASSQRSDQEDPRDEPRPDPLDAPLSEPVGEPVGEPPAWTPSAAPLPSVPPPPPVPPVPDAAPAPPAPLTPPAPHDSHEGLTRTGAPDLSQPAVTAPPTSAVARLEFAHGERVDVDRVIIIGRAPEAGRFSHAEQPRLVPVPSPHQEISSTHIEVRPGTGADHGAAVVTDLGSTNGTVVVQPGQGPEELRPGVPMRLVPGALIDLGDGMTIRVED